MAVASNDSLVLQVVSQMGSAQIQVLVTNFYKITPPRGMSFKSSLRASLVAQLVKNLPAIWESWVRSLAWEDALEKGEATHSSILASRTPWTPVYGVVKSQK